jgi:isopropylmalate/homocitrate/citramalate synthase
VKIAIGKKSGADSILYKSAKLGLKVNESHVDEILLKVKDEAIRKKRTLTDREFSQIVKMASERYKD